MFRNRHVIIALLVTPVLAVLAWLGVGQLAGETPAPAEPGRSYPLVEQPNCRYASGACDLRNAELELRIVLGQTAEPTITVTSSHPLERVQLALASGEGRALPGDLARSANGQWVGRLALRPVTGDRLRLVAQGDGAFYYGEVATAFARPGDS
ncbi:hypothetical protein [Pseudohaliea rubra]|uniref:Uncharacterized protein n=1 Tax=Pseudohaliea rubra DSM 19751 TaxID=1265313 RepID=A0A095XYS8_9GAMM|nr:hypothetical protein [Pseudohaliea rubra]KGE04921.1 hypothetical protein HRUBRA_00394 [Pseudohaliea rubra DSM 19751]